jgi:CRP/FNR family cyclic AMP-dependent transcriptional regulator
MPNMDLLQGLDDAEAGRVLALGKRMTVESGGVLFRLGESAESVYLIGRGRIRLTLPMQVRDREENVLVEEQGTGQTVGWSALTPPYRFTLTATAPLDTELVELGREALNAYFSAHPETGRAVAFNLASVIGQRLQIFQAMWLREVQRMVEQRYA